MEITIMASLFAEWDMDVNHGHKYTKTGATSAFIHIFSSIWGVVSPILLDIFIGEQQPVLCHLDVEWGYFWK
ncbi:hypothetical protein [Sphingobacterium sp. BIGb0165]|uniref:hypothetical protein n=1 Tax=Sphingobacterium sp. BIGb0165 TaxID=2940615 RepID=UPI0021687A4A|nr:hypothetical protein [Sphingobacterium sp. BIGb0165]MCS4228429.1 hypothetical protein [Sphingobacterium sp. BIGb0165]